MCGVGDTDLVSFFSLRLYKAPCVGEFFLPMYACYYCYGFETGSLCNTVPAGLELAVLTRLTLELICLCIISTKIRGAYYHALSNECFEHLCQQ